jgi:hypothetical protein
LPAFLGSVMSATHVNRSNGWLKAACCIRGSSVFFLHFHYNRPHQMCCWCGQFTCSPWTRADPALESFWWAVLILVVLLKWESLCSFVPFHRTDTRTVTFHASCYMAPCWVCKLRTNTHWLM